jgi:hypothetical protein
MNQYPVATNPYAPPQAPMAPSYPQQAPYGQAVPDVRVEGKSLVAANGWALPGVCLKCGAHPTHWRAQRYQYTPPWAFFFFGWIGVLIFSKKSSFQVPLCEQHRAEWKKWNLIAGLSWLPGVLMWVVGFVLASGGGSAAAAGGMFLLLGTLVFFVGLFTALILRNRKTVMPSKIDRTHTWLRGVHPMVLQAVAMPQVPQGYAPVQAPYGGYTA